MKGSRRFQKVQENLGKVQGMLMEGSGKVQRRFREGSGRFRKVQGSFREG